ncbi:hypothetical protein [Sinorhizobium americanum]|uniref:Uncharacterized protein n=1 Tax=Sinorhizobium americanum TaxID=194963 RepID=A0A4R2AS33_9HYPH|nr:hypothetical protein [Sinorhizobium americanum]TCN16423.1 hypothetical protein EV184_1465 [Sinorhizobium americanum]
MFDVAGAQPPSGVRTVMTALVKADSGEVLVASESHQRARGTAALGGGKRLIVAPNAA